MQLIKTDIPSVWMLTVQDRMPYPSVDTLADTALLRHRPVAVAPVSWFKTDHSSWKFRVPHRTRLPLSDAVKTMQTTPEVGFKVLSKTMEAVETASDHLLPIIPTLLHPELIFLVCREDKRDHFDVQIVTLPFVFVEQEQIEPKSPLIEWMGEVFHWDASLISQLADLFHKEAYFDLLLEARTLCGESHLTSGKAEHENAREDQFEHSPSLERYQPLLNDEELELNRDTSFGKRITSRLKKIWRALFGQQSQEMIHEKTEDLDLSSDQFRIAQLSEGLPGTPDEVIGHHAYILTEEFVVGRDIGKSDFWIDSYSVSRQHAVIRRRAGSYFIEDLGSKNGTLLDGVKISKHREHLLPEKCKISFADQVYYFRST